MSGPGPCPDLCLLQACCSEGPLLPGRSASTALPTPGSLWEVSHPEPSSSSPLGLLSFTPLPRLLGLPLEWPWVFSGSSPPLAAGEVMDTSVLLTPAPGSEVSTSTNVDTSRPLSPIQDSRAPAAHPTPDPWTPRPNRTHLPWFSFPHASSVQATCLGPGHPPSPGPQGHPSPCSRGPRPALSESCWSGHKPWTCSFCPASASTGHTRCSPDGGTLATPSAFHPAVRPRLSSTEPFPVAPCS